MIAWRGAGFLVVILGMAAFLAVAFGFDYQAKGTLWPWGLAAVGVGVIVLPLGLVLNRGRRGKTHDFMFIPMQYWGALLLVGGLGALGGDLLLTEAEEGPAATACEDLGMTMAACGPAAAILTNACAVSPVEAQQACLDCIRAQPEPCNPAPCGAYCSFVR